MPGALKGDHRPDRQDEALYRSRNQIQLFEAEVVNDTTPRVSSVVPCGSFRKLGLYVSIDSTSTPDNLHVELEYLDRWDGNWHTFKQGPFAALFWEDTDTAAGIHEAFIADVVGRAVRVKLTGVDVAQSGNVLGAAKYFTVSVTLDFWN